MISSGRTGHAFILAGGSSISRESIGRELAKDILCHDELSLKKFEHGNHEDLILIEKPADKASILKEQIIELQEKTEFKPYGDTYVVIIKDAHLMNEIAQNKLLKSLEEPTAQVVYILLTEREDSLLSTIRSRCTSFHLEEERTVSDEETLSMARSFASLLDGKRNYYKKKAAIQKLLLNKDEIRPAALLFLDVLEDELEQGILEGERAKMEAVPHIETARKYILQGQNTAYTLKQLCLRV